MDSTNTLLAATSAPTGAFSLVGRGEGTRDDERNEDMGQCQDGEKGGKRDGGTQTPNFLSFSPRTCIKLLEYLTPEQLEYETDYFRTLLGPSFRCKPATKKSPTAIAHCLNSQLYLDTDRAIKHCSFVDSTNAHLFALLDEAERYLEAVLASTTHRDHPACRPGPPPKILDTNEPVSFLTDCIIKSDVVECCRGITFERVGGREVAYFGSMPYAYGKTSHPPRDYPPTGIFDTIASSIAQHDPDFDLSRYCCLVTRYKDGRSYIPAHSDNELGIAANSTIYTVSIGVSRTLRFTSIGVPLVEREYRLTDGSVHAMTRASQKDWRHSIPPEPSCRSPRISFTFRKMDPSTAPHQRRTVPPISEDAPPKRVITPHKRVLFLTDSVNSGLDTSLFNGTDLTCIKDPEFYEILDIDKYVHEFEFTDYVIISAGVNDLSRYGQPAGSICRFLTSRIRQWTCRFPNTTFIFNSILFTKFDWLNRRIRAVNESLFDLSLALYGTGKFYFLDTAHALFESISGNRSVLSPRGNGIHLSPEAARITQGCIVGCVKTLDRPAHPGSVSAVWPLRPDFRRAADSLFTRRCRVL